MHCIKRRFFGIAILLVISVVVLAVFGVSGREKADYFFVPNLEDGAETVSLIKIDENMNVSQVCQFANKGVVYRQRAYFVETEQGRPETACVVSSDLCGEDRQVLFAVDAHENQLYTSDLLIWKDVLYMPVGKWLDNRTRLGVSVLIYDFKTSELRETKGIKLVNSTMFDVYQEKLLFLDEVTLCPCCYDINTGTSYALSEVKGNLMSNLFQIDGNCLYYLSEADNLVQIDLNNGNVRQMETNSPEKDDYLYWIYDGWLYYFSDFYSETTGDSVYFYGDLVRQSMDSGEIEPCAKAVPYDRYAGAELSFGSCGVLLESYTPSTENEAVCVMFIPYSTNL